MAMLVPIATFLNVQSLTVPLAATRPALFANFVALAFGLLATVADFMRMLEKKIKWTTRLIVFGSACQGAINVTVILLYVWSLLQGSPEREQIEASTLPVFFTDGLFFTFLSAITSILAAYLCSRELQLNTDERQVYIYTMASLSPNQRQLTMLTILSFTYLVLAGILYSFLESWDLNAAFYFVSVVSLSIGFGDLAPTNAIGKFVVLTLTPIGISLIGLNIYAARQVLLELFTMRLADTFSQKFGMKQEHRSHHSLDDVSVHYEEHVPLATQEIFSSQIRQALMLIVAQMLFFATVFSYLEGWDIGDGVYFTFIAISTIGLGDFSPITPLSRGLFIWFVFFGVANVTYLGSMLGERIANQWTIEVGLIENRVGRYEVKARMKRDWGAGCGAAGVAGNSAAAPGSSSIPVSPRPSGVTPPPRIVRITNRRNEFGTSLPAPFAHARNAFGFTTDDIEEELPFSDDDEEEEGKNVLFSFHRGTTVAVGAFVSISVIYSRPLRKHEKENEP
ncbi:Potassium channel [Podochytrium sp. JEL0797]|nr:Potassium channel [Podochytrium sp. JEL0797]